MSWDRDRNQVTSPSSEDMCWLSWDPWWGDGGGGGSCLPYCEDRQKRAARTRTRGRTPSPQAVQLQVDYKAQPTSWREALAGAELVAVIELKSAKYVKDKKGRSFTRFDADVIEVIKTSGRPLEGSLSIPVTRFGGVKEIGGQSKLVEERRFATWTVGQRLLVFMKWFDGTESYTLPFGPDSAFELDGASYTARAFSRSRFSGRHNGKPIDKMLDEVRSAR